MSDADEMNAYARGYTDGTKRAADRLRLALSERQALIEVCGDLCEIFHALATSNEMRTMIASVRSKLAILQGRKP